MNKNINAVKLTENDKKTIMRNSNLCSDSHGRGCVSENKNDKDKNLN